jgi:hypothetical protein
MRYGDLSFCLRIGFSENRITLFGPMLLYEARPSCATAPKVVRRQAGTASWSA